MFTKIKGLWKWLHEEVEEEPSLYERSAQQYAALAIDTSVFQSVTPVQVIRSNIRDYLGLIHQANLHLTQEIATPFFFTEEPITISLHEFFVSPAGMYYNPERYGKEFIEASIRLLRNYDAKSKQENPSAPLQYSLHRLKPLINSLIHIGHCLQE